MKGYVRQRRGRYYAVIYEGRDPVTGKERRSWHPAGTDRAEAERLAARLAAEESVRIDAARSLTFGAYLTGQWLPAKKLQLATSTYRGYERNVQLHVLPAFGTDRDPTVALPADRSALRHAPAPDRPVADWRRRPCTRSISSSRARSPTRSAEGSSPATSPSSPAPPSNERCSGSKAPR